MSNPYESFIEETRWGLSSKEEQSQALFKKYVSLHPSQKNLYVQELIKQFEDTLEELYLMYENHYNDQEVGEFEGI